MNTRNGPGPKLISADYDGTQFMTSEAAPGGITVDVGYYYGIRQTIGEDQAEWFKAQGGHNHRSPVEIVASLAPNLGPQRIQEVAFQVVGIKLEVLRDVVGQPLPDGTPWPRASDGMVDFWKLVDKAKAAGEPIGTAVISNGHTKFEQDTFAMLGLTQPDIFVTDDTLQTLGLNMPPEQLVKPAPFMLRVAQSIWRYQASMQDEDYGRRPLYTAHIGDSEVKDGGMAANAGVDFVLLTPETARDDWQRMADLMGLGKLPVRQAAANA